MNALRKRRFCSSSHDGGYRLVSGFGYSPGNFGGVEDGILIGDGYSVFTDPFLSTPVPLVPAEMTFLPSGEGSEEARYTQFP